MPDVLLTASAPSIGISLVAAVTTGLVGEIRDRHDLAPTVTAAVGRLTTGAALLGANLKGRERLSLQIAGDGPIGTLASDAWLMDERTIAARGFARYGQVDLPVDARGKFDVAGAVGRGSLQVTRSRDIGQPYVGIVGLRSGEIAEDIAAYLVQSEQIPSVVALGVLANPTGVIAAGGIIAQVLPGADERAILELEARALEMPPVTSIVAEQNDVRALVRALAGDVVLQAERTMDVRFACLCTRAKVEAVLRGLGSEELRRLSRERDQTEAICEYCQHRYVFTEPELEALAE